MGLRQFLPSSLSRRRSRVRVPSLPYKCCQIPGLGVWQHFHMRRDEAGSAKKSRSRNEIVKQAKRLTIESAKRVREGVLSKHARLTAVRPAMVDCSFRHSRNNAACGREASTRAAHAHSYDGFSDWRFDRADITSDQQICRKDAGSQGPAAIYRPRLLAMGVQIR